MRVRRERLSCHFESRRFEEAVRILVTEEQALKLEPKALVPGTSLVEESGLPALLDLQGRVKDFVDLPPAFRLHRALNRSARPEAMPSPASSPASRSREIL